MILYLYTYVAENSTASGDSALIDCILGVQSQSSKMVFNISTLWFELDNEHKWWKLRIFFI